MEFHCDFHRTGIGVDGMAQQDAEDIQSSVAPGYYYPLAPLMPQWGTAPVTAIAYDNAFDAMYVASPTLTSGQRGGTAGNCQGILCHARCPFGIWILHWQCCRL